MSVEAADIWREKADEELLRAAGRLDDYLPEGREAIRAELERRGLSLTAPTESHAAVVSAPVMRHRNPIARLWAGEYPLPFTYWICGWVLNLALGMVVFVVSEFGGDSVPLALLAILLALAWSAYGVLVLVGIWRSAGRYTGPQVWATLARAVVAFNVAMSTMRTIAILFGAR